MEEGRSDDGRFTPEHTDGEILAAVRTHEPAATSEVAGELDMTRQGADRRLRRLREAGRVNSKKIGASLVWFDADAGDAESGREPDVTPSPDTGGGSAPSSTPSGARDTSAGEAPESNAVAGGLSDVDFPAGREREACSAAVYAARDYLRDHGPATMREIVAEVLPEHPLGYDVAPALEKVESGDRFRGSWWRKVVKPGLEALPDVEAPAQGASEWRYIGEGKA